MLFDLCSLEELRKIFFRLYHALGFLFLLIISALLFFFENTLISITAALFILVVTISGFNRKFRENQFSISFCFFTILFLEIPLLFIVITGENYIIGQSVGPLPYSQTEYFDNLYLGIFYLLLCWISIWLALLLSKPSNVELPLQFFQKINSSTLLLIGLITALITFDEAIGFISKNFLEEERSFSIAAFLFSDQAYLLLTGAVLIFKQSNKASNSKNNNLYLSLVFIIFAIVNFSAGSKAAPLVVFIVLILCPLGLSTGFKDMQAFVFKNQYILLIIILSPLLYFMAHLTRLSYSSGVYPNLDLLFGIISDYNPSAIYDLFGAIGYRLAWGGLDQFLLLFHSFILNSYDISTSLNLLSYIAKNFINLVSPGTPFMEAYAPSSQLFYSVIAKNELISNFDKISLVKSLSTQPYTLFGFFVVIFGIFAPLFLFIFIRIYHMPVSYTHLTLPTKRIV